MEVNLLKNKLIGLLSKLKLFYQNRSSELKTFSVIMVGCLITITVLNKYFITTKLSVQNVTLINLRSTPVIIDITNELSGLNEVTFKDISKGTIYLYKIICPGLILKPKQVVNVNVGKFKTKEEQTYFTVLGPDQFCTKP